MTYCHSFWYRNHIIFFWICCPTFIHYLTITFGWWRLLCHVSLGATAFANPEPDGDVVDPFFRFGPFRDLAGLANACTERAALSLINRTPTKEETIVSNLIIDVNGLAMELSWDIVYGCRLAEFIICLSTQTILIPTFMSVTPPWPIDSRPFFPRDNIIVFSPIDDLLRARFIRSIALP